MNNLAIRDNLLADAKTSRFILVYSDNVDISNWLESELDNVETIDSRMSKTPSSLQSMVKRQNDFEMKLIYYRVNNKTYIITINSGYLPLKLRSFVDMFVFDKVNNNLEYSKINVFERLEYMIKNYVWKSY